MSVILRNEQAVPPGKGKEYLCYFMHRLLEFRCPEVETLASMEGYSKDNVMWRLPAGNLEMSPFWYVNLPNEEVAKSVSKRCMLTKAFIDVWGEGSSWEELRDSILSCDPAIKEPWYGEDVVFKVVVEGFGVSFSMDEQLSAIKQLNYIPFKGKVNLKKPEVIFRLIICDCRKNYSLVDGEVPYRIYFGREVSTNDRHVIDAHALRKRAYIGPTSMDCEMSFVMCNQARVRRGDMVFDPYAGTGSILVAAGVRGARVWGADLDARILRDGKTGADGKTLTLHCNFEQYGLPQPAALLRMDAHTSPFRPGMEELFDAIIGDPPYGVRAGGRKCGPASSSAPASEKAVASGAPATSSVVESNAPPSNPVDLRDALPSSASLAADPAQPPATKDAPYIPMSSLQPYLLGECLRDLLELSARLLTMGGRLVYFLPCTTETYGEDGVPGHPALALVANSEQILTSRYSRRLITMEKVRPYDAAAAAEFYAANPDPTMAIDRIRDIVYEQIDATAIEGGGAADSANGEDRDAAKKSTKSGPNSRRLRSKAF